MIFHSILTIKAWHWYSLPASKIYGSEYHSFSWRSVCPMTLYTYIKDFSWANTGALDPLNRIPNWVIESSHNWEIQLNASCLSAAAKIKWRNLWMETFLSARNGNSIEMAIKWVILDSSSMNGKFSPAMKPSAFVLKFGTCLKWWVATQGIYIIMVCPWVRKELLRKRLTKGVLSIPRIKSSA